MKDLGKTHSIETINEFLKETKGRYSYDDVIFNLNAGFEYEVYLHTGKPFHLAYNVGTEEIKILDCFNREYKNMGDHIPVNDRKYFEAQMPINERGKDAYIDKLKLSSLCGFYTEIKRSDSEKVRLLHRDDITLDDMIQTKIDVVYKDAKEKYEYTNIKDAFFSAEIEEAKEIAEFELQESKDNDDVTFLDDYEY